MTQSITNARGMNFTCSRSWEEMTPMEGGRFCNSCQKPVIDFTGWDRNELIAFFKTKPDSCGQFEAHQVDPSLIPIEDVGNGIRRGFFASLTALALASAQAQDPPAPIATEQVLGTPIRKGHAIPQVDTASTSPCIELARNPSDVAKRSPNERRVYLSSRFPFVHVRRRHFRGRAKIDFSRPIF